MKKARIRQTLCVSCGSCVKVCPKSALQIDRGMWAVVNEENCVGCGLCAKACPASVIQIEQVGVKV